jgi:tetratricopeptide (TPR) repeat protein
VESVLDGTIQREGELIRVSVRLIKVDDGSTLWAETFDEKFTYIFALQDSISKKVARSLLANLTNAQEQQLTSHSTANAEAFEAYQLGVYFWNKRTKVELEKAVGYFTKAVELDPNYGLAYAMLADSHNMLHYYGFAESAKEAIESSERAAAKSLAIDETIAEAHIAMSYVHLRKNRDAKQAKISLERAIALSPYNPAARIRYGWQLLREGKLPEASEQMQVAQENDPISAVSNSAYCSVLMLRRQNQEALKFCSKAAELQPEMPALKVQLGVAKFLNGFNDEAIDLLRDASKTESLSFEAKTNLAFILAKLGRTAEAEAEYAQLLAHPDAKEKLPELALAAFALQKTEDAHRFMNEMIGFGYRQPLSIVADPLWLDVLEDPKMRQLAEKLDIF